jgi:hypothetical protein
MEGFTPTVGLRGETPLNLNLNLINNEIQDCKIVMECAGGGTDRKDGE